MCCDSYFNPIKLLWRCQRPAEDTVLPVRGTVFLSGAVLEQLQCSKHLANILQPLPSELLCSREE